MNKKMLETSNKFILGRLTSDQKKPFDLLSARSWNQRDPRMGWEVKELLENKDSDKMHHMVDDSMFGWKGEITRNGSIQLIMSGHQAQENPEASPSSCSKDGVAPRTFHRLSKKKTCNQSNGLMIMMMMTSREKQRLIFTSNGTRSVWVVALPPHVDCNPERQGIAPFP
jgi:hypothetical protein